MEFHRWQMSDAMQRHVDLCHHAVVPSHCAVVPSHCLYVPLHCTIALCRHLFSCWASAGTSASCRAVTSPFFTAALCRHHSFLWCDGTSRLDRTTWGPDATAKRDDVMAQCDSMTLRPNRMQKGAMRQHHPMARRDDKKGEAKAWHDGKKGQHNGTTAWRSAEVAAPIQWEIGNSSA